MEEAGLGESLSSDANEHVKECAECATSYKDRLRLRQIVSSLGTIEVPGDFDFRLRARLTNEKPGNLSFFSVGRFAFGARSVAFAAALLLIGSTLLFLTLRSPADNPQSARVEPPTANQTTAVESNGVTAEPVGLAEVAANSQPTKTLLLKEKTASNTARLAESRSEFGAAQVAFVRDRGRVRTRDLSSLPATVLRREESMAAVNFSFPIGTSYQSLKVSLDNGSGVSRTIYLPSISFGSQRVLAGDSAPIFASSAKGSW
jgi:hypothetical protein